MIAMLDAVVRYDGSIVLFTGLDTADGRRVLCGVDRRMAADIIEAIEEDGSAAAYVEPWAVLGRSVDPETVP